MRLRGVCTCLALALVLEAAPPRSVVVEIDAGAYDRQHAIVFFELPDALRTETAFRLTRLDTNRPVDVQYEPGPPPRIVWIVLDTLAAGNTLRYRLEPAGKQHGTQPGGTPQVMSEDDGKHLTVRVGQRTVLRYNEAVVPSSVPGKPQYRRSGYIHPVYDPAGRPVTDDMAPDHAHQHGIMFAYQKVTFRGRGLNFWEPGNGTTAHDRVESSFSGSVFGGFRVALRHDENDMPGAVPVLRETWEIRVYNLQEFFVFDLVSFQSCATEEPVVIEKNSYGGLAIRGHRNWFDHPDDSEYLTSEGKGRKNGNQTRPRWVDLYGLIDGKPSGVAVMDHPENFRFPQPVRLHPEKPYFCFAPMAVDSLTIAPTKPLVSRYRYYVHAGDPDSAQIEMLWHDYADPMIPRVMAAK